MYAYDSGTWEELCIIILPSHEYSLGGISPGLALWRLLWIRRVAHGYVSCIRGALPKMTDL